MADINIYGTLFNATTDNIIAYAKQILDEDLDKTQSEINNDLSGRVYTIENSYSNIEDIYNEIKNSYDTIVQNITNVSNNLTEVTNRVTNIENKIESGEIGSGGNNGWIKLTQDDYDSLEEKDSDTLYIIVDVID